MIARAKSRLRRYHLPMSKKDEPKKEQPEQRKGLGGFQKISLGAICVLFVVSILSRVVMGGSGAAATSQSSTSGAIPAGAQGFVSGDTPLFPSLSESEAVEEEPETLESMLPVLTEASFFAMIGFALGYASRKVVKVGMIVLAGFFVLLQLMTYAGVTTIDWGKLVEILNDWILNLKENQTITAVLTDRVPTAGSLIAGYFLGFRKG